MEKQIIKYAERYIKPAFKPIYDTFIKIIAPQIGKLKKLNTIPNKWLKSLQTSVKGLLQPKEQKATHYFRLGRFLIAKRLLLFAFILICLILYFLFIKPPAFVDKWFNRITVIHEKVGKTFNNTGKTRIISSEKTIKYEGALVDGLYNGIGTLYNNEGGIKYKGEFKTGAMNGAGELYNELEQLIYKGSFADDVYSGQGTTYGDAGLVLYEGEFKNNKPDGTGRAYSSSGNLLYEGMFSNGIYNGMGKLWSENGDLVYEGNFQNGFYSGEGTDFYANKLARYKGLFLDGKYSGAGQQMNEDGTLLYEGNFKNGLYSGAGVEHYASGLVQYKGEFLVGQYSGLGELINEAGVSVYKGSFFAGKFNGTGDKSDGEGILQYSGPFKDGLYQGIGTLFAPDETILYKGFFVQDRLFPQGFLGISRTKLEAIAGDPSEITVNEDLSFPDSLISIYNDQQLSYILKLSSSNPKESYVSKMIISSTGLMTLLHSELKQGYVKGDLEDVGLRRAVNEELYSITYKIEDTLFAFFYNTKDNSLNRLEIS